MTSERAISHRITNYPGETEHLHRFGLTDNGEEIGELWISPGNLQIMQVWTRPDRRREGIATALYNAATGQLGDVMHSPAEHRTPEGHGWAERVGGPSIASDTDTDEEW